MVISRNSPGEARCIPWAPEPFQARNSLQTQNAGQGVHGLLEGGGAISSIGRDWKLVQHEGHLYWRSAS